jgi:hypothetical protein
MNVLTLANVDTTPTGTGIQHRARSILTSDRAAASLQPRTSVCDVAPGSPSRALRACHRDR